ncbi:MAG: YlbF family regulator [Bacilli bacterium]|nr:YlbF family regulator [Bacilli bacterium]
MQVNEIINKIDNSKEIKRFKELEESIKNNKEYITLMNEFNKQDNPSNEEIIELRKKLFQIDGVKEYLELEKEIRLFSKKTSNIIASIVDNEKCEK